MANNLFANVPAACVAKSTISFATAGITALNTLIIFEVGSPLKSYVPGRTINSVTGFTADKGYYIVPAADMDLSAILAPPLVTGGGGGGGYSAEASVYIDAMTAAGTPLSTPDADAWNVYVNKKVADGTWTKRKFVLPLRGATAALNAVEGKAGGTGVTAWVAPVTHSLNGVKGDGITGHGVLAFDASVNFVGTNVGGGVYFRSDEEGGGYAFGIMQNSGAGAFGIQGRAPGGDAGASFSRGIIGDYNTPVVAIKNPDPGPWVGWVAVNKMSNTHLSLIRNGVVLNTDATANSGVITAGNMWLCAINIVDGGDLFSDKQIAMLQFWEDLTDAQVMADNADIEELQDAWGRGVQ
jgi:hypothetical protein